MQNAGPAYLSSLFCLAPDPICLHSSRSRKAARFPGLIFSLILPVSYAAAPLAVYPRRSVIAWKEVYHAAGELPFTQIAILNNSSHNLHERTFIALSTF